MKYAFYISKVGRYDSSTLRIRVEKQEQSFFSKRVVPREYKQKLQKKIPPRKDSLSFRGFFVLFRKYCIRLNEKAVHPIEQKP